MSLGITPSQTVGPYLHIGLPEWRELVPAGTPGALRIRGIVLDGADEPVPDALIEAWDAAGRFARSDTRDGGRFELVVVKPAAVAWPDGGLQAPHLEVGVFARGLLKRAVTRLYFPDEVEANASDPVLAGVDPARRATLVAVADGDGLLRFDIRLQGGGETVFFAL
jgi:protocatechuate 3,4-dioxygenase alpha subunit